MNLRTAYCLALLLFLTLVALKFSPQTGFTSLIRFGETWQDRRPSALLNLPLAIVPNSNGYDGQFYAQIALDPLLRSAELKQSVDAPEYRARRILAPATAAILGFGSPWWTLQAYALLNVICWLALGWLLRPQTGSSNWTGFARWVGCMFSMGVLESVRQSLVDLPALLLLVLAVKAYAPVPASRSTLWLALGNLAKETTLLGTFALQGDQLVKRPRWKRAWLNLAIAALPIALWSVYVHTRFIGWPGSAGSGNFTWPLLGLLSQTKSSLQEILQGNLEGRHTFGLIAIAGLLTQLLVLWRSPQLQSPWWRIGAAYSILLLFLGSWVWSGYWAACRALLPMTVAFNLLLPAQRHFWPLWVLGNLTLLHAVWRFL